MIIQELIAKVRDQQSLSQDEMHTLVQQIANGQMNDAQVGAFAMAVLCRGLDEPSGVALALGMRDSGRVLKWKQDAPVIDKHSTGGIGDSTSIALAPILADLGAKNPMISGRGLGHTGGTLDKLEAIPGFRVNLSDDEMNAMLEDIGCFIVSASQDLAPADRRLYSIRDVTATVSSIELITASILSKKLAAGLDGLLLDVKFGRGAIMRDIHMAQKLGENMVKIANKAGCNTFGLLTNMNTPLAKSAGNALELREMLDFMEGAHQNTPLADLTKVLCIEMAQHFLGMSEAEAKARVEDSITSGRAREIFDKMVHAQGGKIPKSWPDSPVILDLYADQTGAFHGFDAYEVGMCVVELGGGRKNPSEVIDFQVGLSHITLTGERVKQGDLIARIHANDQETASLVHARMKKAILKEHPIEGLVHKVIKNV